MPQAGAMASPERAVITTSASCDFEDQGTRLEDLMPPAGAPRNTCIAVLLCGLLLTLLSAATSGLGDEVPSASVWLWAGDVTPTSFQLRVQGEGLLTVARAEDPETIVFSEVLSPLRVHGVMVTGLAPNEEYVYSIEGGPAPGRVRTWAHGVEPTLRVATAGCAMSGSNAKVFEEVAAQKYDMFIHMGDMHYADIEDNDVEQFRLATDKVHGSPRQQLLFQSTPVYYMWDDHDYGPNDSNMLSLSREAAMDNFKSSVPHPSRGGQEVYYAYSVGRTRFVMIDTRSESIPGKQLFSGPQRSWLLQEIRGAGRHKLLVLMLGQPWIGKEDVDGDGWRGHLDARQAVSTVIGESVGQGGYDNIVGIASDSHMAAFDDGSNTDFSDTGAAGFPLMQAGPLARLGSCKGGPYMTGCYGHQYAVNQQYGSMEIKDDGGNTSAAICVHFRLHRATEGVLFEKEMCGPFLGQGAPQSVPSAEPMTMLPMLEWILLMLAGSLLFVETSMVLWLAFVGGQWQKWSGGIIILGLDAFMFFQAILLYVGSKSQHDFASMAIRITFVVVFQLVLLAPLVVFLRAARSESKASTASADAVVFGNSE